jgi:hypothetical protein
LPLDGQQKPFMQPTSRFTNFKRQRRPRPSRISLSDRLSAGSSCCDLRPRHHRRLGRPIQCRRGQVRRALSQARTVLWASSLRRPSRCPLVASFHDASFNATRQSKTRSGLDLRGQHALMGASPGSGGGFSSSCFVVGSRLRHSG